MGWDVVQSSYEATPQADFAQPVENRSGHLDGVIAMVEDERYCPEIMKQVSALQASLERVNRVLLQNHLETCVSEAVAEGRTAEIVDELLETMKYTAAVTGPIESEVTR